MVSSMTGLGLGESKFENRIITVEIRSVNNRYLEFSTRLPVGLSQYEQALKELIRKIIHRGKLYVNISVQGDQNGYNKLRVVPESVLSIRSLLESLREEAGISDPIRLDHFLQYTDIFEPEEKNDNLDEIWICTQEAVNQALFNLREMRLQEGSVLLEDIYMHLVELEKAVVDVKQIAQLNLEQSYQKMVERIQKLLEEKSVDQDRLYTEMALLADKLDITEECVRLESHHCLFRDILKKEEVVGKKLNFLLQEMNREVNTISSKANNSEISHLVVTMKEEIEKLREQAQNLE
jgi:uncharacterized protein (TIGR00255 family)